MTVASAAVEACCASLYGHPLVELLAGQSFHPGGLTGTRRLLEAARLPRGARILDAGCGLGASARLAALFFGLTVEACDVSAAAIGRARTLAANAGADIAFVEASLVNVPYQDGRFAGVLAECVLSTCTAKAAAFAELRRVLTPGGALLISDMTTTHPIEVSGLLADVLCLSGAWQPGELEDSVGSSGFQIEHAWDETGSLAALLDRLEARAGLLTALARDLPILEPLVRDTGQEVSNAKPGRIAAAFVDARRLVAEGLIGYRAVVARASAVETGAEVLTTVRARADR